MNGFITESKAQELFVFSEPASNMPAKSIGLRMSHWENYDSNMRQTLPEFMISFSKNLMLHVEGNFGNRFGTYQLNGGLLYAKYKFLNNDQVKSHFRMATFLKVSQNRGDINQEELSITNRNSGVEIGIIATKLLHKTALSGSVSISQLFHNQVYFDRPIGYTSKALNYSLSYGRLILPKKYKNYKQINMNLMFEMMGQQTLNGKSYLDIGPSVQFIFNSQTRVDIGYKKQIQNNMTRYAPNALMIRIEHLLFNVL